MNKPQKLTPFKHFCLSVGVIPSAYTEAMSYYELLEWLCQFLQNNVIPTVNNNSEVVTELQNYVSHYFDNLDVQEKINNKLDETAEDGVLADIIADYVKLKGQLTYNTVQEMKLAENLYNGSFAKTYGFYNYNDGGGALYKIRTVTNEDVIDEMTIIALADTSLIAELIVNDVMSPEQLGAYGDGIHDDTTPIQKLFEVGSKVLFGHGKTYKTTNVIDIPSNITIDMNNSTISFVIEPTNTNNKVLRSVDTQNIIICNGKIRTDYLDKLTVNSQVIGIYLGGTTNVEIYNMDFGNCGGPIFPSGTAELQINQSDNNHADHIYVHDCTFTGVYDSFNIRIYTPYQSVASKQTKNVCVERCIFNYAVKSCVEIAGLTTHHNIVKDCEVMDCGTEAVDIDKTSYNNTIKNVVVHNCTGSSEVPEHVPFGGISIQHRSASDSVSGYYSHDNIVENCIIENTVGCGFYTNTRDFKFINCVCKNAVLGMFISGIIYPTIESPRGEVIGCELHGTDKGIEFNRTGDVIIDKCKIYGAVGVQLISQVSGTGNVCPRIINSEIHHGNKGIYTQVKNIDICGNKFYDDVTPLSTTSASGIFASSFDKLIISKNHFLQTTLRDVNAYCKDVETPSVLLIVTDNYISNSTASPKVNITGGQVSVCNVMSNSTAPSINAGLVVTKLYE